MTTLAQRKVLDAIRRHVADHGCGPTFRWLCQETGTTSSGSMSKHIAALERRGLVFRGGEQGQITPVEHCPVCGSRVAHSKE